MQNRLAPRRLRELAEDASHSAGAVAWLEKPLTDTSLEEKWDTILGPIPDAPGLEDLDELHPMKEDDVIEVSIEEDGAPMINLPPLPLPELPIQTASEEEIQTPLLLPINPVAKKKKKSKLWWLPVLTIIILVGWQLFASYSYFKFT